MKKLTKKQKIHTLILLTILIVIIFCLYKEQPTLNNSKFTTEDNYQITYDYIKANGCNEEMSNNEYTTCVENTLGKIQTDKKQSYDRFQNAIKDMDKNALGLDEGLNKEFEDWYKSSDDYNHSRCVADVYWSGSGSAYNQNIAVCQIFETQRDIQLLNKLYVNKDYFKN